MVSYLLVAAVAGCVAFAATLVWVDSKMARPLPPLLRGISPKGSSTEFAERLATRFVLGSPESVLIHELWLNDFQPETGLDATQRKASFMRGGMFITVCRHKAAVEWSADDGRLTAISGTYFVTCL